jgi:hypothetical protein
MPVARLANTALLALHFVCGDSCELRLSSARRLVLGLILVGRRGCAGLMGWLHIHVCASPGAVGRRQSYRFGVDPRGLATNHGRTRWENLKFRVMQNVNQDGKKT